MDRSTRPGRPRTSTDERRVNLVADDLEEYLCARCEKLSRATGVPAMSVILILINDLRKKEVSARGVPHCLTAETPGLCNLAERKIGR